MSERDPRDELRDLIAGFRTHLGHHMRAGSWAAPGGPLPIAPPALEALAAGSEPHREVASAMVSPAGTANTGGAADDMATARHRMTLAEVREELGDCQRCGLAERRNKIVFGVGSETASLMFVGEAPGAQEDRRGEPFVGPAGELLDKMILAMGWTRDSVYIANVLKCRPPGNRDPKPDEVEACEPFLARQIDAISPRVIVTLGKPAAHLLLRTRAPISALRGKWQSFRGIQVMPTFHPAYLLRNPERKRDTWSDLKKVIARLSQLGVVTPAQPKG